MTFDQSELEFLSVLWWICVSTRILKYILSFVCYKGLTESEKHEVDNWVEGDPPPNLKTHSRILLSIIFILHWLFFFNSALIVSFIIWRKLL